MKAIKKIIIKAPKKQTVKSKKKIKIDKPKKPTIKDLLKTLKIDETFSKRFPAEKKFNKVKDNIPHIKYYNYMCDLLYLPEDVEKYKYLLVCVDLATNKFDVEPLTERTSKAVLEAFKNMFEREYIKKPYASVRTDAGTEFQGDFNKYLKNENILHRVAMPGRHKQVANVESLNRTLGRLINGYMNTKERTKATIDKDWIDCLPIIRKELNEIRAIPEGNIFLDNYTAPQYKPAKFNIGDFVHYKLSEPESAIGLKQKIKKFREGDNRASLFPKKIVRIFEYSLGHRYQLEGMKNVSFGENELMKDIKKIGDKKIIEDLIDKKTVKGVRYWLVKWDGLPKKEASWEKEVNIYDDTHLMMKRYNDERSKIIDDKIENKIKYYKIKHYEDNKEEWKKEKDINIAFAIPIEKYEEEQDDIQAKPKPKPKSILKPVPKIINPIINNNSIRTLRQKSKVNYKI